jgi:hypothetical protein
MDLHGLYGFPSSPSKWIETGCSDSVTLTAVMMMSRGPVSRSSALSWSDFGLIVLDMSMILVG